MLNAGLFDKLRVYRVVHTSGPDSARPLVLECQQKYRDRHPFFYLDSIACGAWLDRLSLGRYTADSENALSLFDTLGARGLRAILVAQGILVSTAPTQSDGVQSKRGEEFRRAGT